VLTGNPYRVMRLLDTFPVLLLDMNGTFMFGADRFSVGEDSHATFRVVGGLRLSTVEVTGFIRACSDGMGGRRMTTIARTRSIQRAGPVVAVFFTVPTAATAGHW
jgi:hypothetical protein